MKTHPSTDFLLMSIVDSPEKDLSNVVLETIHEKSTHESSKVIINISSSSICAIYNRVNCDKKQRLVLKSYFPGINTSIFPNRHNKNIFSEQLVN